MVMLIDLARLSLATGDGCLVPEASTEAPWYRDAGDGLSLSVGTGSGEDRGEVLVGGGGETVMLGLDLVLGRVEAPPPCE